MVVVSLNQTLFLIKFCFLVSCMLRFSYEGRWKQKLQTTVDFPLEGLDLSQYVIAPRQNLKKYCLYGVSVSRTLHCAPTC